MKTQDKLNIVKHTVIEGALMALLFPIPLILLIVGITLAYRL